MDAAVVEFDSLPDAVGAPAQNDDLAPLAGLGLASLRGGGIGDIAGIHVGRGGSELAGAGIDALVDRLHPQQPTPSGHLALVQSGERG